MADPEVGLANAQISGASSTLDEQEPNVHTASSEKKYADLGKSPAGGSKSSGINVEDPVTWHYLQWNTALPSPAFLSSPNAKPESSDSFPSRANYEQYQSPTEWSESRKNFTIWLSCAATAVTAYTAGSYIAGDAQMEAEWHVSQVAILVGVTTFTTGFAVAPMVLAPFSEINGRRPVFVVTGIMYVILQICCAVTHSYPGMLVARFFTGFFSSSFSTMVGGVVSDLYVSKDRNTAMTLFSGAALFGTGLGPMVSSFIAAHTTWRWIFWLQVITCGSLMTVLVVFFKETRGTILLSRRARAINQYYEELEAAGIIGVEMPESDDSPNTTTQRIRWKVKSDEERTSLQRSIGISVYRAFFLLFTEPTVFFFSLWISFAWSILYLTFSAIPLVYTTNHNFTLDQNGAIFSAISIASLISTVLNIYGDKLVRKRYPHIYEQPEGRLYITCIQSALLPIGLFWFITAAYPSIPWIVPTLAIGCATMGIFSIYLAVFNYLADTYGQYASSALAAQSFCRNMLGGVFPLVTDQMFRAMTFTGASAFLGGVGAVLTLVPFVLIIWGSAIRKRSKFASGIA